MDAMTERSSAHGRWVRPAQWTAIVVLGVAHIPALLVSLLSPLAALMSDPWDPGEACGPSRSATVTAGGIVIVATIAALIVMIRTRSMIVRLMAAAVAVAIGIGTQVLAN
jgi:predicted lysophospholipase L1 biosynthesis ABC-type transport system permease subunit